MGKIHSSTLPSSNLHLIQRDSRNLKKSRNLPCPLISIAIGKQFSALTHYSRTLPPSRHGVSLLLSALHGQPSPRLYCGFLLLIQIHAAAAGGRRRRRRQSASFFSPAESHRWQRDDETTTAEHGRASRNFQSTKITPKGVCTQLIIITRESRERYFTVSHIFVS